MRLFSGAYLVATQNDENDHGQNNGYGHDNRPAQSAAGGSEPGHINTALVKKDQLAYGVTILHPGELLKDAEINEKQRNQQGNISKGFHVNIGDASHQPISRKAGYTDKYP